MNGDTAEWNRILLIFALGFSFSAIFTYYNKKLPGGFIRKLIDCAASSEQTAKTLNELGYRGIRAVILKNALKQGKPIRRMVRVKGDPREEKDPSLRGDRAVRRYFLPEELREIAARRYCDRGATLPAVILAIVLFLLLALVLGSLIPAIYETARRVPEQYRVTNDDGYTPPQNNDVRSEEDARVPPEFQAFEDHNKEPFGT